MASSAEEICRDVNQVAAWLARDDFGDGSPRNFEAIVVFGNQVLETLVAGCRLAQQSLGTQLVLSGGRGHSTPALFENLRQSDYAGLVRDGRIKAEMTEAAMYAAVAAQSFGIAESRLLLEPDSRNGGENARFSLRTLRIAGIAAGCVVLIQDPTMQRRTAVTWDRERLREGLPGLRGISHAVFVPQVEPGPAGLPQLVEEQRRGTWTIERYLGLVMGEMERLRDDENGYGPRGRNFLVHVEIPDQVWQCYLRVRESPLGRLRIR